MSSPNGKVFSILGKNIKANSKADLEPFLTELAELADVEEVHFGGNSLGVEACEAIAEVLKDKKGLKIVDLADIFTGRLISEIPQALSALCNALIDHKDLVVLDLSDNAFGGRCADAMVPFLSQNHYFNGIKLNNTGLGVWGGTVVADALLKNAKDGEAKGLKSALRVVVCGRSRLENGSAPHWAAAFAAHGGLVEVRMPQNGIRMEGIEQIAQGLSKNPNLEILDLQDNTATRSGTRAIVKVLPQWPGLRSLNLSDCLLGKAGGIALATALQNGSNPKLESLKLQYGEFDKRTFEILAVAISQHLKDLKELELNGNQADPDDECIEEVRKALALHGNEDALDDLDDMEEPESGDEDESEEEEEEAEAEDTPEAQAGEDDGVAAGVSDGGALKADTDADDLADVLAGVKITNK
ncbi:Ran GTPase-activating protein 1 [Vanrija pseudolonga]|uniref:Ran GTPase-activating protein 1 n=1 Tax=Vanrija pseudolonga TaxID=143232 RepID=A0AAF1BF13_9TREE|nr:Ran GTPase-activating protein 1 [Vanrija pseudolonga]